MSDVQAGTVIASYVVDRAMNSGGMGSIYLAHNQHGDRFILKFPHVSILGDPAVFERYQRELAIGKLLKHPRVQHVIGTGDYDGQPYMVAEFTEGETLRKYLNDHPVVPVDTSIHILDELCQGVTYCHELGVFHRDLKPENIVLTPEGDPVIIDFGIALLRGARRITWSGLSSAVGTPDYMAPEQIQGKRGDARTDIYSLGAIGYEMLTGQPPFIGDNPLAVMSQHLYGELRPPRALNQSISPALNLVIMKSLQHDPDERFANVEEFRQALLHPEVAAQSIVIAPPRRQSPVPIGLRGYLQYGMIGVLILVGLTVMGLILQLLHH